MAVLSHQIELRIGSLVVDVWDGYDVATDLLRPGAAWNFRLWRTDGNASSWAQVKAAARAGARLTLSIDGSVQLDGHVETTESKADREGAFLMVSGLDLAGAAQEADADPRLSFRGLTLQESLERLFAPLGITLELGDGVDPPRSSPGLRNARRQPRRPSRRTVPRALPVDRFRPRVGDKVWKCADALVRRAGYMLWAAAASDPSKLCLRIDQPKTSGNPVYYLRNTLDARRESDPLESSHSVSVRGVPTSVTVFAESGANIASADRIAREVSNGTILDPRWVDLSALPQRPRYSFSSRARTLDHARREATRVMGDANGQFRVYTAKVQGHGQLYDGSVVLWQPNEIVSVVDEVHGLDESMLIRAVKFCGSREGGQTTELTCIPLGTLDCDPVPDEGQA